MLHVASKVNDARLAQLLIDNRAKLEARVSDECTPLYMAVHNGHYAVTKVLLNHGADTNTNNNNHYTALMNAS